MNSEKNTDQNILTQNLIACHQCDLLQQEIELPPGGAACCACCGATLYRNQPDSINRSLALTIAASVFFLVSNYFPIIGINLQGNENAVNLFQAVQSLWQQKMYVVSGLTFFSAIFAPSLELGMMLYILTPLNAGLSPPKGTLMIMRLLQTIKPWGMIEVFMLGILVSLVKLVQDFRVLPGVALWSFGGLTILMAAASASFNPRDVWTRLELRFKGKGRQ